MTETTEGGVYATFTYVCHLCGTTVRVVDTVNQGHLCQPSPERFLAQPSDPEEDLDEDVAAPSDPLESIAGSLRTLVALVEKHDEADSAEGQLQRDYDELEDAYRTIEAEHDAKQVLLDEVLRICKPSTSKLANSIRAALDPDVPIPVEAIDTEPEPDPEPDTAGLVQPRPEAPVEEWREYARGRGYQGPDVDTANRSQIRTMLGIPHGEEVHA